jgi:predicted Zn-dependent protease
LVRVQPGELSEGPHGGRVTINRRRLPVFEGKRLAIVKTTSRRVFCALGPLHALPVGSEDTIHLARHYVEIDRPQAALDALARAKGEELDDPEHWAIRGEALLGLGRPDESADAARRGLELDPEDIELLDVLAVSELRRER